MTGRHKAAMKILVNTYYDKDSTEMAIDLIPKGIEPVECATKEETLVYLKNDPSVIVVVTETKEIEFLQEIKKLTPHVYIFLIYHSSLKPQELLPLMKVGIAALIEYSNATSVITESIIQNIIRNNIRSTERRLHIRVAPNNFEKAQAAIYVKDMNRFVKGELVDLSAGGIAVRLQDTLEASILNVNNVYDPLLVQIRGMEIRTLAKLVGRRQLMTGFKFENVEEKEMKKLSSYIYMRIMEQSKNFLDDMMITKK